MFRLRLFTDAAPRARRAKKRSRADAPAPAASAERAPKPRKRRKSKPIAAPDKAGDELRAAATGADQPLAPPSDVPSQRALIASELDVSPATVDGARLAVIRGHVTSDKAGGHIASYDATRDWLMLSSYHLTEERLPEYLAAIERFQPDLLHAYPSAALQLAEFLERAGQPWRATAAGGNLSTLRV